MTPGGASPGLPVGRFFPLMDGNGVAKEFWTEVFDLHAPIDDDRGRRETRRKKQRRVLVRRSNRVA